MSYMNLSDFALLFGKELFRIMRLYKEFQNYRLGLTTTEFNIHPPQNNFYLGFDKTYLFVQRQHQDRYGFNHRTQISQKGLEIRLKNQGIKKEKTKREREIQDCFSIKIKSRRWAKRHHNFNYTPAKVRALRPQ